LTVRAVVTNVSGLTMDPAPETTFTVISGIVVESDLTIDDSNASTYAGQTLIVKAGTTTIVGPRSFARLVVLDGAKVTHPATDASTVRNLAVVADRIYVACGGSIDVSGRGYPGGQTYPGTPGAGHESGGSHLGGGGLRTAPVGATYGSIYRPQEQGAGGEHTSYGRRGGGVVRIAADTVVVDGAIRANGADGAGDNRGGAGGSVWVTAAGYGGSGRIEARGGNATYGGGGGGAIAVEYERAVTETSPLPSYGVHTGTSWYSRYGGAGTVWIHGPGSVYGDLTIDNVGRIGQATDLPSLGFGYAEEGSAGLILVTDRAADVPPYFLGHFVEIRDENRVLKGIARISAIAGRTLTIQPLEGHGIDVQPGDSWRGAYYLDSLALESSTLRSPDLLRVTATPAIGSGSKIVGNNEEPPKVDMTRVSIVTGTVGSSVVGTAGAVADVDLPLTAIARNERTGIEFTAIAAADGSFMVAVGGEAGDAITIRARDGNVFPLESRPIEVGTLPSATPESTRLDQSTWGVDGGFRARTIERDGSMLAIGSYPADGTGSSNRVVMVDISNPAAPAVRATLTGTGALRDIAVHDGWAFVAADRFWAVDLGSATPAPLYAFDVCGREHALVVSGGYAFGAEGGCDTNKSLINVYDVSTPAAPRYLYSTSVGSYSAYAFTDLFTLGTNWLIGISDFRPGGVGRDLIVIDRRDPSNLKNINVEKEIENFDAFRGALNGDVLWVVSRTSSEVATFDLSNPAAPALIARA
ncbi:MAG: hypothetical protein LC732_08220, partial [Acidobacteria bacterium]|nr:hypothetical protein [Acidobacteriota bacterium]